jgi:hypothetical protein
MGLLLGFKKKFFYEKYTREPEIVEGTAQNSLKKLKQAEKRAKIMTCRSS